MDIQNALERARMLINDPGFNARVEAHAGNFKSRGKGKTTKSAQEALYEQQLFGIPSSTPAPSAPMTTMRQPSAQSLQNSNLPQEIVESFKNNPSPLVGMEVPPELLSEVQKYGLQTQEPVAVSSKNYTPKAATVTEGVNYELIKYIVNECLNEKLKGLLNESEAPRMQGMRFAPGNVIQFYDTKGNLYEGKFTLKKRKNQ